MILFLSDLYLFMPFIFWALIITTDVIFFLKLNLSLKKPFQGEVYLVLTLQKIFLIFIQLLNFNIKFDILLFNNCLLISDTILRLDMLVLLISFTYLAISKTNFLDSRIYTIEVFIFIQIAIFGIILILKSIDIIVLFIAFELQTFALYGLALLKKNSIISNESGLKYFLTGALISSIFVLGSTFFYGLYGTLNLLELRVITESKNYFFNFYFLFFLILFFYKLGVFPMSQWMPDVYEASQNTITFFFSLVPKMVYIFCIIMFLNFWLNVNMSSFYRIFIILSTITIASASIFSLNQIRLKRLLTYSGVVQIGYVLLTFGIGSVSSVYSGVIFLSVYVLGVLTIWNSLLKISFKQQTMFLTDFIGLNKVNVFTSASLLITLLNFASLPPFLGFFTKLTILNQLLTNNNYLISLAIVLTSALTIFYYLKLCYLVYFKGLNNYIYNFTLFNLNIVKKEFNFLFLANVLAILTLGFLNNNTTILFLYKIILSLIN